MSEYTKGPWEIADQRLVEQPIYIWKEAKNIAEVNRLMGGEGEANAQLISASPELLEHGYVLAVLGLQSDRYHSDPEFGEAVDNMLYAVQKAKGGE